jgi:hypothetical protein
VARKALLIALAALVVTLGLLTSIELRRAAKITVTVSPQQAVYTVGRQQEATELRAGARVIRYGPLFWGLYPGAVAFRTPSEALKYLQGRGESLAQWQVFQLSGEYDLDVEDGREPNRINKSLVVTELVRVGQAATEK